MGAIVDGNLGVIYEALGRYPEAEPLLKNAEGTSLELHDKRFYLKLKIALAGVTRARGRIDEAIDTYRDVLRICEATYGPEDRLTYLVISDLASAFRIGNRLDEAEALYPRVLSLGRRLMGPDHHDILAARQNFAAFLHVRGRFELAEAKYREVIDAFTRTIGPEGGTTLLVVSNLGELYRDWGRPNDGAPLLARAVEGQTRVRAPIIR